MDKSGLTKREAFLAQTVKALEAEVRKLSTHNSSGFLKAFEDIEHMPSARAAASMKDTNRKYNRYNNIVAFDHSRVKVKPTKANQDSDYINANFIKDSEGKEMYIATQAPVPDAFNSFWQMVWEQKLGTIVMVTNEVEGGKLKCHRYWPDQHESSITFGDFVLSFSFQEVHPSFVRRVFQISAKGGKESRDVTQYAFTAWPDHGVPATTQELLDFREQVRREWNPRKGKLLVHCSAGVGRTGTFIALDRYIESLSHNKAPGIYDLVCQLRSDRNFMVQSQIQYIYLHHVCLDGAHDLLMDSQRELRRIAMSEEERQEEEFHDLEDQVNDAEDLLDEQIERGEDQLDQTYQSQPTAFKAPLPPRTGSLRKPKKDAAKWAAEIERAGQAGPSSSSSSSRPAQITIHASGEVGKYTDDLPKAARVSASLRRSSLLEIGGPESEFWRTRKNTPMSLHDKGYLIPRARDLTARLQALDQQKSVWKQRYQQASERWDVIHLDGGEVYDLNRQLTPLESRLESLAVAEEAWLYRGDGFRSAREEDVRRTLARLTQRLQSLQETLLNSEARWRARGDGMRQKAAVDTGLRVHTTDKFGGLMERLELLQQEEQAWIRRDNFQRFDRTIFESDVKTERTKQEREQQSRDQAEQQRIAEAEYAAARAKAEQEARLEKMTAEQREVARREDIKERMKAVSVKEDTYDPGRERMMKQKQKEDEERLKADTAAKEERAKQEKDQEEQAKKKEIDDAKKKASRFLGKLKL